MHALPGGALTTFPCKFAPPNFFSALGAPSAPTGYAYAKDLPKTGPEIWSSFIRIEPTSAGEHSSLV